MLDYAKDIMRTSEYFKGLNDSDLDYILFQKWKNAVRERRLQAFRRRKIKSNDLGLQRWSQ